MVFWFPIIFALYPGTLINDTWGQLSEYIRYYNIGGTYYGRLSDHHPFVDTLIMGSIITPFGEKLQNWQLGFFVYTILQVILTACSFSCAIIYLYKKLNVKSLYLFVITLFYSLCPIFPISAQTISKDALFAWVYVLFMILFVEAINTQGKCFYNIKYVLPMIAVSVLCICTKKVGLYVIGISLLSIVVCIPKVRVRSLVTFGIVIFISVGIMGLIKSSMGVLPGGKQEMVSIPFQQTARYIKEHKNDITKQEYQSIGKLIDIKTVDEKYDPINADPIKGYEDKTNVKEFKNYLLSWYQEGLRHPKTYFAAFNAMVSGWFSFTEYIPLTNMEWHSQLNTKLMPESSAIRPKFFNSSSKIVQEVFDNLYYNSIFQIFLSYAFYAALMPGFIVATICRKWDVRKLKYYWIMVIPLILSIVLGCWLSPVSIALEGKRYLYPVIYTIPFMIGICFSMYQDQIMENNNSKKR